MAAALVAAALLAPAVAAAGQRLSLPTEADAVAVAAGAEEILFGPEGIERVLPGPVADAEEVLVEVAPGGEPVRVVVEQRLTLTGLGDYRFRVPGPAKSVRALPGSEAEPGLRRGSMLWQGFSPGERHLAAVAELHPEEEAARLPLAVTELAMRVDGRPLDVGETGGGAFELELAMENVSEIPIQIATGRVDRGELALATGAVRAALEAGERPRPGSGGVPADVGARAPGEPRLEQVEAPFRVQGELVLPPGAEVDEVSGAEVDEGPDGTHLRFEGLLGGGEPMRLEVRASGSAPDLGFPSLDMTAVPAPPSPAVLGGDLDSLMDVLWRVARLRQYDGYLGNPDPTGSAETVYRFALVGPAEIAPPAAAPPEIRAFGALGWIAALIATALVLAAGGLLWSRS